MQPRFRLQSLPPSATEDQESLLPCSFGGKLLKLGGLDYYLLLLYYYSYYLDSSLSIQCSCNHLVDDLRFIEKEHFGRGGLTKKTRPLFRRDVLSSFWK